MIQPQTRLKVADNTGAKEIMCFRVMGGSFRQTGSVGDIIMASVKSATPGGVVKKCDVVKAAIIRPHQSYRRPDGTLPLSSTTTSSPRAPVSLGRSPASCVSTTS